MIGLIGLGIGLIGLAQKNINPINAGPLGLIYIYIYIYIDIIFIYNIRPSGPALAGFFSKPESARKH